MAVAARKLETPHRFGPVAVKLVKRRRAQGHPAARIGGLVVAALALGLTYVALTAGVTAQTYRLSAASALHAQLLVDDRAAHDRVAELQSLARLEEVAARLKMTAPAKLAVIASPPAAPTASRPVEGPLAVVTRWLSHTLTPPSL